MAQKKNTDQVEVVKNETAKNVGGEGQITDGIYTCLLYTSPSPRD